METKHAKFLNSCLKRWRKMGSRDMSCASCDQKQDHQSLWPSVHEGKSIPKDVPKGHLVVYVGENSKRFVIKIGVLKHPLFRALLDETKDEYDFTADSKFCIPCDENIFLDVIRCASSPQRTCLQLL